MSNQAHLASSAAAYDTKDRACNDSALSPILRLPPELLATIFVHCARDYYDHHQNTDTFVPSWVNVSYVCRHWRSVALGCPTLWAHHFVVSPRWTEELLVRSRQAPLRIRAMLGHELTWFSFVDEWMMHVERIQELILHLPDRNTHQFLSMLSLRAPLLQTLKISIVGDYTSPNQSFVLFGGDYPALRILELSHYPVALSSLKLTGLTTLVLRFVPIQFRPNMEELLAMLNCIQDLTHLDLHHALASVAGLSSVAISTWQKINLPRLSRFSIAAPLSTVIALLSWLNMPLRTEIALQCEYEVGSDPDDYSLLSSLLAQRLNMAEDQTVPVSAIRSLTAEFKPFSRTLIFSASEPESDSFCLRIGVEFSLATRASDMNRFTSDICCLTPLKSVQGILVQHPPISSAFWGKMLEHLPNLRRIKLRQGYMPDLASVLSHTTHEGDGDEKALYGHPRMLAPALEELELDQITFLPEDATYPIGITQRTLLDALSTRDAAQGRLAMTECRILGSHSLPDMVRSWDGGSITYSV